MTMTKTAPKTKQKTYKTSDVGALLGPETLANGVVLKYKTHPNNNRSRWYYKPDRSRIQIRVGENCIKTTLDVRLSVADLERFIAWLDVNAVHHSTTIRWNQANQTKVSSGESLVPPTIGSAHIESKIYRRLTDEIRADLATIEENRKARVAKERAAAAAAKKKRDAEARAAKKRADDLLAEQQAVRDVGDLAAALKVLKKHGLRVVTVAEKEK